MNLASILDEHPPDDVALISRAQSTTYGELSAQVGGLRGGLVELGIEPGDRVGIVCANNWYFVAAYLAIAGRRGGGGAAQPAQPGPRARERAGHRRGPGGHRRRRRAASGMADLDRAAVPDPRGPRGQLRLRLRRRPSRSTISWRTTRCRWSTATPPTWPCWCSPAAPPGGRRRRCCRTATCSPTSPRSTPAADRRQTAADVSFGVLPLFHIFGLKVVLGCTLDGRRHHGAAVERFDPARRSSRSERTTPPSSPGPRACGPPGRACPTRPPTAFALGAAGRLGRSPPAESSARILDRFGLTCTRATA